MKTLRTFALMLSIGVGLSLGSLVFAEGDGQEMRMGGGQGKGNKMMGMMHQPSVTATSDGGVVILAGPKLIKYDKDLNLVKEVEIPKGKKPGQREEKNEEPETAESD